LVRNINERFSIKIANFETSTAYGGHGNFVQAKQFLEVDQPETRIAYGGHVC
jgi:hypothetical protein